MLFIRSNGSKLPIPTWISRNASCHNCFILCQAKFLCPFIRCPATCFRWISHDVEGRKQHIVRLLKCIRLGLLSEQFFVEVVKVRTCSISIINVKKLVNEFHDTVFIQHTVSQLQGRS